MATNWRAAKSLLTLREQVNNAYPNRSKISDGLLGDTAHQATASDHNPNSKGVVCALDLTHDPKNGFDAHALADYLRKHRHPNLRYVISNARIASARTNWKWAKSSGHTKHIHISVGNSGVPDGQSTSNYDSTKKWDINYGGDMLTKHMANVIVRFHRGTSANKTHIKKYVGKVTTDKFERLVASNKDQVKAHENLARKGRLDMVNHLPANLRRILKGVK